ncbi:MAG: LysR substrate-binding domain-containing protein [Pseudomonadales bacterium]|nr:LysR substrate-binding domain-containing protein [Pseudomonadales bacterium]NRA17286.1 LysR family transcriptional regulator [Oceanospirillaceae bacterium]
MNLLKKHVPNIHNLHSFVSAAKHNSFTQAAIELHLTQSAISRQIKDLETQLGVPLFKRIRQRVLLTDTGSRFLEDAVHIIQVTEDAMLRAMSVGAKSSLRIAALPTFTSRWIIPKLSSFIERNPNTALSFSSRTKPFDFNNKMADLAIHFGKPSWPQASCYLLCREQMIPVASQNYLTGQPLSTLADVQQMSLLQLASRLGSWKLWFEQHQLDISHNNHLIFDQFSMIVDALKADLGIALLPKYFIADELADGSIVQLAQGIETEDCYYLVIPDDKADNPQVISFKDWILGLQQ